MTANTDIGTGAPVSLTRQYQTIDWKRAVREVRRVQRRIAEAVAKEKWNKVKVLQRMLTRSYFAKVLAVKKVCSNKGARTPGIDGKRLNTPAQRMRCALSLNKRGYRAQPLRRIHIPKKPGSKETRPLGISVIQDRVMMTLHQFALEPIAETRADTNSYGFRPYRAVRDAVSQVFNVLRQKSSGKWILEADIKACFDGISHEWMLENIPTDHSLLQQWLTSGFMDKQTFFPTHAGVPQGAPIAPTIANMVLDGLEKAIKAAFPSKAKVHFVRYADDFIVTAETREALESVVMPVIEAFLEPRGLTLSRDKTKITHINDGFDFLGKTIRRYGDKLITQPSKKNIKSIKAKIRNTMRLHRGQAAGVMIKTLNPIIRGWSQAHNTVQASKAYGEVDEAVYQACWRWAMRAHPRKSKGWIFHRYFGKDPHTGKWRRFHDKVKDSEGCRKRVELTKASDVKLVRYIKVRGGANPHRAEEKRYFMWRRKGRITQERTSPGRKRSKGTPATAIKLLG